MRNDTSKNINYDRRKMPLKARNQTNNSLQFPDLDPNLLAITLSFVNTLLSNANRFSVKMCC